LLDRAVTDDSVAPRHPTDAQFKAEVAKVVPWNDYAGPVNVIITPPGVIPAAEAGGGCGHHGSGNVPDPPDIRWYSWADVPWGLISANPSGKCQPYGNAAYGLSVVAAHEWAETVTDPFGASSDGGGYIGPAWADTSTNPGNEIADLCDNANPNLVTLSTGKFELPELWSNEAGPGKGECVMGS